MEQIRFMEAHLLPPPFGAILEKSTFLSEPSSSLSTTSSPQPLTHPSWTLYSIIQSYHSNPHKKSQLETFLQLLSQCCGRRGGRYTLGILFDWCCFSSSTKHVNAHLLIEWLYRFSISCIYLQNPTQPLFQDFLQTPQIPNALVMSLLEATSKHNSSSTQDFYASSYNNLIHTNTSSNTTYKSNSEMITKELFLNWAQETTPLLSSVLPTFFHQLLFADKAFPPSRTPFLFPYFHNPAQNSFILGSPPNGTMPKPYSSFPFLFSFACMSNSLGGMWYRLFSSDADGMSFNRLLKSILGYSGPTLLIIKSTSGSTFGAFTSSKWIESSSFYGTTACFLYQLEPVIHVYRPRMTVVDNSYGINNANYMYCNPEARSKGYDGLAHGIGFGGDTQKPRLFISETLDDCIAQSDDLTFERGDLFTPVSPDHASNTATANNTKNTKRHRNVFEIEQMEVWGVGGDTAVQDALQKREDHRQIMDANIQKARKVDKAQFLDDFKSGLIESKAFQHREQIRGRDDAQIDEEHGENAYQYEK